VKQHAHIPSGGIVAPPAASYYSFASELAVLLREQATSLLAPQVIILLSLSSIARDKLLERDMY
jgi:hypothetical protein